MRIDDRENRTQYKDRYNKSIVLKKGMNHIRIDIDSLITSGTNRRMDSDDIYQYMFFVNQPKERTVLYVDNIRLSG